MTMLCCCGPLTGDRRQCVGEEKKNASVIYYTEIALLWAGKNVLKCVFLNLECEIYLGSQDTSLWLVFFFFLQRVSILRFRGRALMPFLVSRGMVRREKRQKGLEKLCLLRPIPKSQARRGEGRIPDLFWPYHPFLSQMTFFVRNVVLFWAFFCAGNEKKMAQKRTRVVFPPRPEDEFGIWPEAISRAYRAHSTKKQSLAKGRRRSFYTLAVVFPSLLFHFFDLLSLSF